MTTDHDLAFDTFMDRVDCMAGLIRDHTYDSPGKYRQMLVTLGHSVHDAHAIVSAAYKLIDPPSKVPGPRTPSEQEWVRFDVHAFCTLPGTDERDVYFSTWAHDAKGATQRISAEFDAKPRVWKSWDFDVRPHGTVVEDD